MSIRQGRGTMVTVPDAQRSANPITSTTEVLMQAGYNVKTVDTHIDTVIPDASVLKNLWLPGRYASHNAFSAYSSATAAPSPSSPTT